MAASKLVFTPEKRAAAIAEGLAAVAAYEARLTESQGALAKTRAAAATAEQNVRDCQANLDAAREAAEALPGLLENHGSAT